MTFLYHTYQFVQLTFISLNRIIESGRAEPVLYHEKYTLDNIAQGLEAIQKRMTYGKAIIRIREPDGKVMAKL